MPIYEFASEEIRPLSKTTFSPQYSPNTSERRALGVVGRS